MSSSCTSRHVKEAVALADRLKSGPFESDAFKESLNRARNEIALLSEPELDARYFQRQKDRLQRINQGSWILDNVGLEFCITWPQFGSRKWAEAAPVNVTTDTVRQQNDLTDRLWEMSRFANLLRDCLPIVVLRTQEDSTRYFIDDGAHRAVAFYLAGFRTAPAYIGSIPAGINHTWKWKG